jgi:hypothetical protein
VLRPALRGCGRGGAAQAFAEMSKVSVRIACRCRPLVHLNDMHILPREFAHSPADQAPALMRLALDISLAGLALGVE